MNKAKKEQLIAKGWKFGDAKKFLGTNRMKNEYYLMLQCFTPVKTQTTQYKRIKFVSLDNGSNKVRIKAKDIKKLRTFLKTL